MKNEMRSTTKSVLALVCGLVLLLAACFAFISLIFLAGQDAIRREDASVLLGLGMIATGFGVALCDRGTGKRYFSNPRNPMHFVFGGCAVFLLGIFVR